MTRHFTRSPESWISSVFLSSPCHVAKPSRYFPLGLPLGLFSSILPVVTKFSNPFLLITCPTNFYCLRLISLISLRCSFVSWSTWSLVFSVCPWYSLHFPQKPNFCSHQMLFSLTAHCPSFTSIQKNRLYVSPQHSFSRFN